jgi:hypothetical protein
MSPRLRWTPGDSESGHGNGLTARINGSRAPSLFSLEPGRGFDSRRLHQLIRCTRMTYRLRVSSLCSSCASEVLSDRRADLREPSCAHTAHAAPHQDRAVRFEAGFLREDQRRLRPSPRGRRPVDAPRRPGEGKRQAADPRRPVGSRDEELAERTRHADRRRIHSGGRQPVTRARASAARRSPLGGIRAS